MYTGRPAPVKKRWKPDDDPPPPQSRLWPDIDTFRRLLRSEAKFRLRILGNGFAEAVKDESDWRLDLYKNWLWTLHRGVGKPFVESRSDRTRRRRGEVDGPEARRRRARSSSKTSARP
jgi:hypothetical protein